MSLIRPRITLLLAAMLSVSCGPRSVPIPAGDVVIYGISYASILGPGGLPMFTFQLDPTPQQVGEVPSAIGVSPVWSRNGLWIASLSKSGDAIEFHAGSGDSVLRLPLGVQEVLDIAWARDGGSLVFSAVTSDSRRAIYTLDLACLTDDSGCSSSPKFIAPGSQPSLSSDGQWIAYTDTAWECSATEAGCSGIFVQRIDGDGSRVNVAEPLEPSLSQEDWPMWGCANAHWSPSGSRLVFACGLDIFLFDSENSGIANLTGGMDDYKQDHDLPAWWPRDTLPSWNATGDRILFVSEGGDDLGQAFGDSDFRSNALFMMNPDGSNAVRITTASDWMITGYSWIYR